MQVQQRTHLATPPAQGKVSDSIKPEDAPTDEGLVDLAPLPVEPILEDPIPADINAEGSKPALGAGSASSGKEAPCEELEGRGMLRGSPVGCVASLLGQPGRMLPLENIHLMRPAGSSSWELLAHVAVPSALPQLLL